MTSGSGVAGGRAGEGWARSPEEIATTYAQLGAQMQQIAARPNRTVAQLSVGEHYALGVRAAAQWTTGRNPTAPLTDEALPPDAGSAVEVVAVAEYLIGAEDTPDQITALAGGVRAWLRWLVGTEDRMAFRPLD